MSNFAPIVDRIRIIPRPADFLSRNSGNSGEVFFNRETNSLRVYSGKDIGGFEIARSDFDNILSSAQIDIQSQKNRIRFHWDTLEDLETEVSPVTYHGMIAHVHSEGRLYFAHAAEWVPVANLSEVSESSSGGTSFSGDYNDLINTPSIPQTILDLNIADGDNGQVLTTDGAGNFSFATVSISENGEIVNPDQNLFATIAGDSGTTTADSVTDTLTIAGGTGIVTFVSGDTVTITQQSSATSFASLTEVNAAGLTVDKIYEPAIVMFRVNNVGTSSYTFAPHYTAENPDIYVLSGTTVAFDLDEIGGHPFALQDSQGNNLSSGLVHVSASGAISTGSNAQGKDSGTLYWRILETLFGTYRYQCLSHASMVGGINIKRLSVI